MSITTTQTKVTYGGNGSTTVWAFPFLIPSALNIVVTTVVSGVTTVIPAAQYQITGLNNPAGGTVTYPLPSSAQPPVPSGGTITIQRVTPRTQPTSLANQGAFYPAAVEGAMDWLDEQIQELSTSLTYSLQQPQTDQSPIGQLPIASARANLFLAFDVNGNPIASTGPSASGIPISGVMTPVVEATSVMAALGLLGGIPTASTIAILRTILKTAIGICMVTGYYIPGDGGGGLYWYNSADTTSSDNGGTIIVAADGGRWYLVWSGRMNLRQFGTKGDGVTDDTTAINAARAVSDRLYAPKGNYVYNGSGLEMSSLELLGDGPQDSIFILGSGKWLITSAGGVTNATIDNIGTSGGYGAINPVGTTGTNVQNHVLVRNCNFQSYTNCAIECNSSDWPYWDIIYCVFQGANDTTTMGIATMGHCNDWVIDGSSFLNNNVDIKLGPGVDANIEITNNDFIHFTAPAGHARYRIWMEGVTTNVSDGISIRNNKFGNENLSTHGNDYHILIAPEGAGSSNGQKFPSLAAFTNNVVHLSIRDNSFAGAGASSPSPVTCYTNQVQSLSFLDNHFNGTPPPYCVEIAGAATNVNDWVGNGNLIRLPGSFDLNAQSFSTLHSNCPGMFQVLDQHAFLNDPLLPNPIIGGIDACGFVDMLPTAVVPSIGLVGTASVVGATDSLGGSDAGTITLAASTDTVYFIFGSAVTAGYPLWFEFDIKSGGGTPLSTIKQYLAFNGVQQGFQRFITTSTNWRRIRMQYTPRATGQNQIVFATGTGTAGTFILGRVRVYHSMEPITNGHRASVAGIGTPTGASILTNFPGATATLAQTSAAVAQLLLIAKANGQVQG